MKKKEEEMLDLQENKFNPEDEKDMKNKERMLKSLEKTIVRNSDFSYSTSNVVKGKKNGVRKVEVKVGDEVTTVKNKEEEVSEKFEKYPYFIL